MWNIWELVDCSPVIINWGCSTSLLRGVSFSLPVAVLIIYFVTVAFFFSERRGGGLMTICFKDFSTAASLFETLVVALVDDYEPFPFALLLLWFGFWVKGDDLSPVKLTLSEMSDITLGDVKAVLSRDLSSRMVVFTKDPNKAISMATWAAVSTMAVYKITFTFFVDYGGSLVGIVGSL